MLEAVLTKSEAAPEAQWMTYEAYLALPHEGRLIEWVEGEVIYSMPPLEVHQDIAGFLHHLLLSFVEFFHLGKVIIAPFEMKCQPEGNSREPDVLFVATANLDRLSDGQRLNGPADLVIEVVSEDSVSRDYDEKFIEYEQGGVQEYWIVDPRSRRKRVSFYRRGPDGLFLAVNPEADVYRSSALPGFWIRVAWIWERPDPWLTAGEIMGIPGVVLAEMKERRAAVGGG
ncbi:MAG: Uma2 family endonuclease [Chloroflexi bacterium]|nr:Uma2 family endonuclease [Chloroflexota bacterium]